MGRLHGLKSGKCLKELRGHASFINEAAFSPDASRIVTGSSDGTVRVWEVKTCDCAHVFRPPQPQASELSVNCIHFLPSNPEHLVVCNKSSSIYIMTLAGQVVQTRLTHVTAV